MPHPKGQESDLREQLRRLPAGIGGGPVQKAFKELVEFIESFENILKDQEAFHDLRAKLEKALKYLSMNENLFEVKWMETDSSRNICRCVWDGHWQSPSDLFPPVYANRLIMEELGWLRRQQAYTNVQRTEAGHTVNMEDMIECCQRIEVLLGRLTLGIFMVMRGSLDPVMTEARLVNLNPLSSARYPFSKTTEQALVTSIPGTTVAVPAEILSWVDMSTPGSKYWVRGVVEQEKTRIAYTLSKELKSRFALAASFFCSRWIPASRDVKRVIPSIACQMARFSRAYLSALDHILIRNRNILTLPLKLQFQKLILKPLKEVHEALPASLVVVIDALDECDDKESCLQLLLLLLQTELPLKVVVFSQPRPRIQRCLKDLDANVPPQIILHELDNTMSPVDIETYLRITLGSISPLPLDVSGLVDQAGNLVPYAVTVTRFLHSHRSWSYRQGQLNAIRCTPPHPLSSPHAELDALYRIVLREIFGQSNLSAEEVTVTEQILDMIIHFQGILTIESIAGLLKLDLGKAELALRFLRPVIHFSEYDGRVVPFYRSFPNYLLESRGWKNYRDGNNLLAQGCFDFISQIDPQFNICRLRSSYWLDSDICGFSGRVTRCVTPTMAYACLHWAQHLNASNDTTNLELLLERFLANHLLLWMEILNLTENMGQGPLIVNMAEQWARQHHLPPEVIYLAEAASRFVADFATNPVSQSTPHIYMSLLPSLPLSDPIRRSYGQRIDGGIQVTGSTFDRRLVLTRSTAGQVYSAAFSPNGSKIVLGAGNDVRIVDAFTGQGLLEPFKGHTWSVLSVAFSPDGTRIASGSRDKTIRVWNSLSGNLIIDPLLGHTGHIRSVVFSPSGKVIVSGSNDANINVWDAHTGQLKLGPLSGHTDYVKSVAIFSDDSRIVSGSKDSTIRIWDLRTGGLMLGPLIGHTDYVTSVSLSHDDSRIVSGSADRTILVWDSKNGQRLLGPLFGHRDWVLSVTFTPDSAQILSGSSDRTVRIWDAIVGTLAAEPLHRHQSHIYSVSCSPDGTHILSGAGDETFCIWEAQYTDTKPLDPFPGHSQAVRSICISSDGAHLVSGSSDQSICVWDMHGKFLAVRPLVGHSGAVNSLSFLHDTKTFVSGSHDGSIRIWDIETGLSKASLISPHGPNSQINTVACAFSRPLIVSGATNGTLCVWSYKPDKMLLGPLKLHQDSIQSAAFSPDDSRLVTGSSDRVIYILDAQTGAVLLGPLHGHTSGIEAVGFSPNSTFIISGSDDTTIRLWDAQTGQFIRRLEGHEGPVRSIQFSPDSNLIASGSEDHTVCVWNTQNGAMVLKPLVGHTAAVSSVVFFPDGIHLASASSDMAIRVWTLQDPPSASDANHMRWIMEDEGWIVDYEPEQGSGLEKRQLAWLNPKFRTSLMTPRNTALFSQDGYIKLGFEGSR
ncbi:hypothetical protein FRC11_007538, partial [Ceratobasidium sp. 423]